MARAQVRNPRSLSSRPAWWHLRVLLEVRAESQGHLWLSWPHEAPAGLMGGGRSPHPLPLSPWLLSDTTFQPASPPSVHLAVHRLFTLRHCAQRKPRPQPLGALRPGLGGRPSLLPRGALSGRGWLWKRQRGLWGHGRTDGLRPRARHRGPPAATTGAVVPRLGPVAGGANL